LTIEEEEEEERERSSRDWGASGRRRTVEERG